MSKLYDKYLYLKNLDNTKIYLIKSGIFYVALEDDALELAEKFNFKLINLNDKIVKCGFPEARLNYYINLLNMLNIKYEVTALDNNTVPKNCNLSLIDNKSFIEKIASLDMNDISYKKSFEILSSLNNEAKEIILNLDNKGK